MIYIRIILVFFTLSYSKISATEITCSLSYDLMEVIATVERSPKRPVGYPFLISFNESVNYKKVLSSYDFIYIDSRTLDCKNRNNCIKILNYLEENNINNLDLGAFQLNYVHHKFNKKEYFTLENSYQRACSFLETLIKVHGYSWETIARYHSSTPSRNLIYQKLIADVIISNSNTIEKEIYAKN